ncbi:MAG: carboxypeptidase regulatory-like domain-containing protein [Candidatus Thorarchaeota archaeon]|nr:MAG: carboxypeptidase regulatory-like domain-containing protein [Candidatus Thorarchaeota archaeon]
MKQGQLVVAFVVLILVYGSFSSFDNYPSNADFDLTSDTTDDTGKIAPLDGGLVSDHIDFLGTLDPAVIEQTGNKTTSILHAETDSKSNVKTNLSIDTLNNWTGSRVTVDLWNLNRLYIENGSLAEGIPGSTTNPTGSVSFNPYGWDATSYRPDSNVDMIAGYSNQEVTLIGRGYGSPGDYLYANGSTVYWTQVVNNTPYLDNFILNFDYVYIKGPDSNPNVTLRVYIDDTLIWTNTTESMFTSYWNNTGDILVDLTGIGSEFEFKIGLYIDGDVSHTHQWIEFTLDNILFVGETRPTFDEANITLRIGQNSTIITGASVGQASIVNSSLWRSDNVLVELAADLSYSFDYSATMLNSRFINSTKSTSLLDDGVLFNSELNGNPKIEFFTFIGAIPDIDDFTLIIRTPSDWENITVFNPSGTPMTSSCNISSGRIIIPNSILYNLGWWEVHLESPNYVRNLQTLMLNEPTLTWLPETVFRSTNITKPSIQIGSDSPLTSAPQNVEVIWLMPNGTEWYSEMISGGVNGEINGSQLEFGSANTTAGIWEVIVSWTNGTELAFGSINFEVHHRTILYPHETVIDTESGLSRSNFVYYQDSENNEFLNDPAASITANWSATTIHFVSVLIENRWVGTFDTSLVGPGSHLVVVNSSRPFYDDASCTFLVTISLTDNDLLIDNPTAEIGIGDNFLATFSYTDFYGAGIPGANVSIDFSGTTDGVSWGGLNDFGDGNYSIEFTAVHSDSYAITISASKQYYEEDQDALFILVGEKTTNLSLENGTSAQISFGEQYRLVVRYTNGSGFGINGATVSIVHSSPETGISYTAATNEGSGFFSFNLTPSDTGTYTLTINASLIDHRTQFMSFTLTATTISTQIQIAGDSTVSSVGVNQPFQILLFYEQTSSVPTNISDASINVDFTSYSILSYDMIPQVEGYLIFFNTNQTGLYEFTITANKTGYQSDVVLFSLIVQERAIRIEMDSPVWYQRHDLNITLMLIEVDTGIPVVGAQVYYRLYRSFEVEMEGYLTEVSSGVSPGVYSIFIQPPWYDGIGYSIRIFVNKTNFALDQVYDFLVTQYTPPELIPLIWLETYLPPILTIAAISIGSLFGRVFYVRKKKTEFAIDLANKRRFDDVDNIIGVIVMHKSSGIPIYSRIVKGGFEEGIVAAFISAVTHFRQEFEMFDEEAMRVIPISDIIRAVQTRNLICAFITVRSASIEHNRKMESYGMQVGTYLDDLYDSGKPSAILDAKVSEMLDYIFETSMDGSLNRFYKIATPAGFPRRYRHLEELLLTQETKHCSKPIYLARGVTTFGVSEARGCTLVSEAIEKELIVQCEEHETSIPEFDFAEFFEERNGNSESKSP